MHLRKSKKLLVAVPAVALTLGAGTALAALTGSAGGAQLQMQNRADNVAVVTSSTVYNDVPGATVPVTVPAGRTLLVNARFTAESNCTRSVPSLGGWCSTRIVATNAVGSSVELNPAAGIDYAFDSVATDQFEGHAMERSLRLGPGSYIIRAQRAVNDPGITFRLDDWHFAVETSL